MGLLDSMFGGGTKLTLALDTDTIPEGGTLSGSVTISGGKKPLKLTALKVQLIYVKVETVQGQTMPKIDLQVLLDNAVVSNQDLPPGSLQKYEFSFVVPKGTDTSGTYKVKAVADIPSVKDPSDDADLKIVVPNQMTGGGGFLGMFKGAPSREDVLARFPALMSRDEDELCEGLRDLQYAAYDPELSFVNIQGFLGEKLESGTLPVRTAALAAWGVVLNDRAKPEHLRTLENLAMTPGLDEDLMHEVVVVAAKFAEEGAFPLVQKLAKHPSGKVRADVAMRMYLDADKDLPGKKELLLSMMNDEDTQVRVSVFRAMAAFNHDPQVMDIVAQRMSHDTSPDVQSACIAAITLSHHHGMQDLVFGTFAQAAKGQSSEVRKEVAEALHWLPADPRLTSLVGALLTDGSVEVRRAMAWQVVNMGDHPELKDLFLKALGDSDEGVRGKVLGGLDRFMPFADAARMVRERMKTDPTEDTYWGALSCARSGEGAEAKALLVELKNGPFTSVARSAADELESR